MTNKQRYHELCKIEPTMPIFSRDWWLDAVCGEDNWDVILAEKGGHIVASWPYYIKNKYNIRKIIMPTLTQTMGIWLKYPSEQKYAKKLAYEKEIYTELVNDCLNVEFFEQSFHYSFTNWLPFYWKGFTQSTRYTYVIENLTNLEKVYSNFQSNIKTDIKKAQKIVECYSDIDIEKFYHVIKLTFDRKNLSMPYDLEFLRKLDMACSQNKSRHIFYAKDQQERIHAAIYLVWDQQSAYYLIGGGHPDLRHSGANSLLLWQAIQFAAKVTNKFDFEGSMMEPVERYFRAFGAVQTPYFSICKMNRKMRVFQSVKDLGRALLKR